MGEADLLGQLHPGPPPDAVAGGGPLAHSVDGQDGGLLEGGGQEGAGGVGLVVVHEHRPSGVASSQPPLDLPGQMELLPQPEGQGGPEGAVAAGDVGQVGPEQALEAPHRLLVVGDVVQARWSEPSLLQAVGGGPGGKGRVVLDPAEALLLGRGHHPPVDHQGRGRVVVEGGYP